MVAHLLCVVLSVSATDRYVADPTVEAQYVQESHVRALALYVKALGMFREGVSVRNTLPPHLIVPSPKNSDKGAEAASAQPESPDSVLRHKWFAVYKWLGTCLARCMRLAEACADRVSDNASTEAVSAEELLYARALRVGALTGAQEAQLRADVAEWQSRRLQRTSKVDQSDHEQEPDDVSTAQGLLDRVHALYTAYSHCSLLLGVLSRGAALPKLDRIRLVSFSKAFGQRLAAARALECVVGDAMEASVTVTSSSQTQSEHANGTKRSDGSDHDDEAGVDGVFGLGPPVVTRNASAGTEVVSQA